MGGFRRTPGSRVGEPGQGASDTGHLGGRASNTRAVVGGRSANRWGEASGLLCLEQRGRGRWQPQLHCHPSCKNWEKLEEKSMELRGQDMLRKKTKHSAGAGAMKQVGQDLREAEGTHPERLQAHHLSVWTETPEQPVRNPGGMLPR